MTREDVDLHWRIMTVRKAYIKHGESHSVPMNEVLTDTLQAVRMDMFTDGSVFRLAWVNYSAASARYVRMWYARRHDECYLHDLRHTFARRLVMWRRLANRASFDGTQGPNMTSGTHISPEIISNGQSVYWSPWWTRPHSFPSRERAGDSDTA
jgi:integrase